MSPYSKSPRSSSQSSSREKPAGRRPAKAGPERPERLARKHVPSAAELEELAESLRRPSRPVPELSTRQRAELRGQGHHLEPVILVGKDGLTEGLVRAASQALLRHELIKIRLSETALDAGELDRHDLAAELADRCRAALVQVLGRVGLLYRPSPDAAKPESKARPAGKKPGATGKKPGQKPSQKPSQKSGKKPDRAADARGGSGSRDGGSHHAPSR